MPLTADDISRLYEQHAQELLAFAVRRTLDPDASVDLVGETFAAAFEDRRQFRGDDAGAARAWLFGIARNMLSDYFRRGKVERGALAVLGVQRRPLTDVEYDRIEDLAASAHLRTRVAEELCALPAEQQQAVRLRVVQEEPYEDLARALGITEQTARARVSRGLRALRATLNLQGAAEHA